MYLQIEHKVLLLGKLFIYPFIIFLSACNSCPNTFQPKGTESSTNLDLSNDTLRVLCTEDQLCLTFQLTKEFQKYHGKIPIQVAVYEWNTPTEILSLERNDLILVSDAYSPAIPEQYYRIKYARDGVVGIINQSNPFCKEILESGLGKQQLTYLLTGVNPDGWQQDPGIAEYRPTKVFICSDEFLPCKLWTEFLGIDPNDAMDVRKASLQDVIDSIRMDPLSMGFCCQRYAYDPLTRKEIEEIKVIPIDGNSNGMMEDKEKFYDHLDELQRAMWLGKYPCHSFLNHYFVAKDNSDNKLQIDFIKWVLTEGQKQLQNEGYILLNTQIINTEIYRLNELLASL
jgi:phosphate transport system substrate-binding protein